MQTKEGIMTKADEAAKIVMPTKFVCMLLDSNQITNNAIDT